MAQHILDMAYELGKLIKESDQFKTVQQKEGIMLQNADAQKLLNNYQKIQQEYQQRQIQGKKLMPEDIKAFEEMELKLLENPLIKDFTLAKGDFDDLLKNVNETINKTMLSAKVPKESEENNCTPSG